MDKIKFIGFDMDYTLCEYKVRPLRQTRAPLAPRAAPAHTEAALPTQLTACHALCFPRSPRRWTR